MVKHVLVKAVSFVVAIALLSGFGTVGSQPSVQALSVPVVTVTPSVVGETAKYTVEFTPGATLGDGDEIWFYFPEGTYLPCTSCNPRILQTTVTVNGVYPILPSIGNASTRIVQVYVPRTLKAGERVTVIIDPSAGVRNPTIGGAYVLGISTTKEMTLVNSAPFAIGASRISNAVVHLTDSNIVGKNSAYLVSIITGYGGALAAGTGTVTLIFPEGTVVPDTDKPAGIAVNGATVQRVETNPVTRSVTITTPVAINAVDLLSITLPSSFGLVNPGRRGEYTLFAHTSAEVGDVRSDPYIVEDAPAVATVVAVTPPAPEGADMWHLRAPMVALNAQSNKDGALSTWYAIDDAPLAPYTQPFQMPDGVHTLRYMSKNETAGIVEETRSREFKVELCAPSVTFAEGTDSILTNKSTMVLNGIVGACASGIASIEIAGRPATISTLQAVTAELLLMEGENDISIMARTNAGNSRLTMLKVMLDSVSPSIVISSHKNWQTVNTPSITVKGRAEADAVVTFEGKPIGNLGVDGSFEQSVTLKLGQNGVAFTATDAAGNRRIASVIVLYAPPAPATIITMTIGSPAMFINGAALAIDANPLVVPVIRSGRTLVPVRSIVQALGGDIVWDAATRIVTITLGGKVIDLTIGSPTASVDGSPTPIDIDPTVVPLILNDRTMIPLRFVSEQLGALVGWDAKTRTITIQR
jgi:hypothetical protein